MATPDRLVVVGSFGYSNIGDEALPLALQDMVDGLGLPHRVVPVSRFDGTPVTDLVANGPDWVEQRAGLSGDRVVIAGGGAIEPHYRSVLAKSRQFLADRPRSAVRLLGVAVEPGVAYDARERVWLARELLRRTPVLTRDAQSARVLRRLLPHVRSRTVGDLVLWLRPEATERTHSLTPTGRFLTVCLAPRWTDDPAWRAWIGAELGALARAESAELLLLPLCAPYDDDRVEHRRVAEELAVSHPDVTCTVVEDVLEPREVLAIIAASVGTVAMRLHGWVLSMAAGVPGVGIGYHPKLRGLAETMGALDGLVAPPATAMQAGGDAYGYAFAALETGPEGALQRRLAAARAQQPALDVRRDELKRASLAGLEEFLG